MKRILLGTTALVAAGVFAGAAEAADNLSFGVRGYMNHAYGFVNEDDDFGEAGDNRRDHNLGTDAEVHFRGEVTLDNGLTVGGRIELEGFTSGDQIDERWTYIRGGFGELRFGDEDDARKLKSYSAPTPTPNSFGVNSPFFTFNNPGAAHVTSSVSTFRNLENDSAKLIYFTPSFGGFQLAASYAPDGTQDRTGFGTTPTNNCNQVSNAISIGADYSGEFSGFTVGFGGGYSEGDRENGCVAPVAQLPDPSVWAVGVNLGFGGFAVGGSILFGEDGIIGTAENTEYDVGLTYTVDAITVGAGWSHGEYDIGGGFDDTLDHAQVGLSYALGPGISVDAMIGLFNYSCDGCANNNGWQAGVAVPISF